MTYQVPTLGALSPPPHLLYNASSTADSAVLPTSDGHHCARVRASGGQGPAGRGGADEEAHGSGNQGEHSGGQTYPKEHVVSSIFDGTGWVFVLTIGCLYERMHALMGE